MQMQMQMQIYGDPTAPVKKSAPPSYAKISEFIPRRRHTTPMQNALDLAVSNLTCLF